MAEDGVGQVQGCCLDLSLPCGCGHTHIQTGSSAALPWPVSGQVGEPFPSTEGAFQASPHRLQPHVLILYCHFQCAHGEPVAQKGSWDGAGLGLRARDPEGYRCLL